MHPWYFYFDIVDGNDYRLVKFGFVLGQCGPKLNRRDNI
jgi:hypothetical protein